MSTANQIFSARARLAYAPARPRRGRRPPRARRARRERHQAEPAGRRGRSRSRARARRPCRRARAARRPGARARTVPEIPPEMWIETTSPPVGEQRLVAGDEVADRGLRGRRQLVGRAQLVEEGLEVRGCPPRARSARRPKLTYSDTRWTPRSATSGAGRYEVVSETTATLGIGRRAAYTASLIHSRAWRRRSLPAHPASSARAWPRRLPRAATTSGSPYATARATRTCAIRRHEPVRCDLLDRRAVRRALEGRRPRLPRGGAGLAAPARRRARLQGERGGHAHRARGVPARGGRARRLHVERRRDRAGAARRDRRRAPALHRRRTSASRTSTRSTRREVEALRLAARRAAARRASTPATCSARGDVYGGSTGDRAPLPARPHPGVRRRRAQRRRRGRRRARPPAGRRARPGRRALHPRQPQLHARPPVRRPRPRLSGVEPPALRLPTRPSRCGSRPGVEAARPGRAPITVQRGEVGEPAGGPTATPRPSASSAGSPSPHEDTIEATVEWYLEREGDRLRARAPLAAAPVQGGRRAGARGRGRRRLGRTRGLWPLTAR